MQRRSAMTTVKYGRMTGGTEEGTVETGVMDTTRLEEAFEGDLASLATWMKDPRGMMHCVVGARGSGRSALVGMALDRHWEGTLISVDLWSMPIESLSSWTPRLREGNPSLIDWSIFRRAFIQLFSLIRGSDLDAQELEKAAEDSIGEGLEAVIKFREGLRMLEEDLMDMKRRSNGPCIV